MTQILSEVESLEIRWGPHSLLRSVRKSPVDYFGRSGRVEASNKGIDCVRELCC